MLYWHGRRSAPTALSSVRPVARQCPAARKLWTSQWKSRGEQAKPKARKVHLWGKMDKAGRDYLGEKMLICFQAYCNSVKKRKGKNLVFNENNTKKYCTQIILFIKIINGGFFFNCNWASCTLTFSSTLPQSLPCCRVYKKKYLSALVTYTTLTFVSGILPDPNCD